MKENESIAGFAQGTHELTESKCDGCGWCEDVCPRCAITLIDRAQPMIIGVDPREVDQAALKQICGKAHLYPKQPVCACSGVFAEEIAAAIPASTSSFFPCSPRRFSSGKIMPRCTGKIPRTCTSWTSPRPPTPWKKPWPRRGTPAGTDKVILFDGSFGHINCSPSLGQSLLEKAPEIDRRVEEKLLSMWLSQRGLGGEA